MAITYNPIRDGMQQVSTLAWESDLDFTLGMDPQERLVLVSDPLHPATATEVLIFDPALGPNGGRILLTDTSVSVAFQVPRYTVATLPASGNLVGQMVYTTDDNNLRMWNGSAWVIAISGAGVVPANIPVITATASGDLTAERVLTAGTNIQLVDGGAGTTMTINVTGVAPNTPSFLVLGATADLVNERVLTAGTNISFVDGGAGGALTINASGLGGGWTDDGTVVRLTTSTDDVAVGTATAFTGPYKLTVNADRLLALQAATGGETWTFFRQAPVNFGSNQTLTVQPAVGGAGLQLHFISATGGQRIAIWDPSNALPNIPHTGILPTFAVYGDVLIGDIVALESNPMTYFIRASTGLAATAVTQLFSSQGGNVDSEGGATIVYAPRAGGVTSDGYIKFNAYGNGSGGDANEIIFAQRSGVDTVTNRWAVGGSGILYTKGSDATLDIGTAGNRVRRLYHQNFRCRAFNGSQTYAGNTTPFAVPLGSESYDTDTMHDNVTNNTRITATTAGTYHITGYATVTTSATFNGNVLDYDLRINGTTFIAGYRVLGAGASQTSKVTISADYVLAATDYVELVLSTNNTNAANTTINESSLSAFAIGQGS